MGGGTGVIALQVFDLVPDYKDFVYAIDKMNPSWVAASTMGFEGYIDYIINLKDYTKTKDGNHAEVFYNIYSLPIMEEFFKDLGYKKFIYSKFEMDIDLPMTNPKGRGTYTVKTEEGKRIQISGGMMMPWYFIYAEK